MNTWGNRRRPLPRYVFSGKKLRLFRERAQLTLTQVSKETRIAISSISDYECGKIVPQLHQFRKLCELYELDPFEICELIKLHVFNASDIKAFRAACKRCDATPKEELNTFMKVYDIIFSMNKTSHGARWCRNKAITTAAASLKINKEKTVHIFYGNY